MELKNIRESLLPFLLQSEFGRDLFNQIKTKSAVLVRGVAGSAPALLAAEYFVTAQKHLLFLTQTKEDALYATTELEELVGTEDVLYYPPSYAEPYQPEKTQNANVILRTEVLSRLNAEKKPKIIVAPYAALAEKVLHKHDLQALTRTLRVGEAVPDDLPEELTEKFSFTQTDFVSEPGEFSVRGGIIDVFSYANDEPYRITLFGNEIENIKTFDIETQLTKEKVTELQLVSNINFAVTGRQVSLLQLLPADSVIFSRHGVSGKKILENFYEKAEQHFANLSKELKHRTPADLYVTGEEFLTQAADFAFVDFANQSLFSDTATVDFSQQGQPVFHKNFELLLQDIEQKKKDGYSFWISFSSEKQRDRLHDILQEISEVHLDGLHRDIRSFISELHEGFVDPAAKLAVYTDHQIFDRYQRFRAKNTFAKSEQLTLKDLMSLKVGDYITHIDHGIGKFMGLVKVTNNGKVQESFKLVYKNGDLLYVSIHALHKISKYNGPEGKEVMLSKLGSPAWKTLTQKTKAKVKQIAFDLIKLYAKRKTARGFAFSPDTYLQNELEASFIYEDTPDQVKATLDVKNDMEGEGVMDRLICGDVGFGKTEVAIRAAFKAATDGKQVAVLVPTTVLAFQHYRSFKERLKDFPVTVSFLNRFRSAKQKADTKAGLKDGSIDIVIGTHQLVGKDIQFKDLGLLIIDEEHKFGVNVKDKLKTFKANIDTLTLTATPIPRTLQFSLMAARDLSVIKTPPPNRQPVDTQLVAFDEELIRDAISYELQRDGQVYFINNRIENLKDIAGLIQRLVPDARVITGHGQMEGKQLEENILAFMEGQYDVLVSTTIVESGVDVPNANTMFINDAHKFGMADLHQMRGRVGRSNQKAFCYLITPSYDLMTSEARKRLEAIEQFSDLGSGFQIAMKDLEIRGAGDLLGAEQSGFINEMGFDAYQKIMQEALEELQHDDAFQDLFENEEERRKLINTQRSVNIDTDLELMLPDEYVQSTEERLVLYQKLAEMNDHQQLDSFRAELVDRFGDLPDETVNLLKSVELKWMATEIGFDKVIIKNGVFLGYLPSNAQDKFYHGDLFRNIITYLQQHPAEVSLKEKETKEGSQLMVRMDHIKNIQQINTVLSNMLPSGQ